MTINCRKRLPKWRYKVYLNGREIKSVWYVDVRRGVLRTFDVYDSGGPAVPVDSAPLIDPTWDAPQGGVLSKEMRGHVVLSKIEKWPARNRQRLNWNKRGRRRKP